MHLISLKKYITVLFCALSMALFAFYIFFVPCIKNNINFSNYENVSKILNISFKVPSPSIEQVENFSSMNGIQSVYPYYDIFATVKMNKRVLKNQYVIGIDKNRIPEFAFCSDKMLLKSNFENLDSSVCAFIDYAFAKTNNLDIDEKITVQTSNTVLEATVCGIIRNCSEFISAKENENGVIIIGFDHDSLCKIAGKTIPYSGAFLQVSDVDIAKKNLMDYKPFGRLKSEKQFSSVKDYEEYLDFFNAGFYGTEIESFDTFYGKEKNNTGLIVFFIIELILILLVFSIILADNTFTISVRESLQNCKEKSGRVRINY